MHLETITFERAVKLAAPVAKKIFVNNIWPIVKDKVNGVFKTKIAEKKFEAASIKYMAKIAGQCSTINTLAFQNAPKKLADLYVPLTIESAEGHHKVLIDDAADIFTNANHVLINDTAGMGKSTLSKRVVSNIMTEGKSVPVFIELRQLEEKNIGNQILSFFGFPVETPVDVLLKLPLVYVFDGLDELPIDKKKILVCFLQSFIEFVGDARILITSRQESFLSEFYSFSRYSIKPLVEAESHALLRKYDSNGEISNKLIAGLRRPGRGLREFLSTPLYVSLLFCAYRYKTIIPNKKDLFYSQVYEALFESHDLSKEIGYVRPKHSGLDSSDFHSVLRRLGFWCMKNQGKIEFLKDELEIIVAELLSKMSGIKATAPNFVKDLTSTVPLFVREGPTVRWSHKSLMEYFAAMFICNDAKKKQEKILLSFFNNDSSVSYMNIFELCADIDFSGFRISIMQQVLREYVVHCDGINDAGFSDVIPSDAVDERASLTFNKRFGFRIINGERDVSHIWGDTTLIKQLGEGVRRGGVLESMTRVGTTGYDVHVMAVEEKNRRVLHILHRRQPEIFRSESSSGKNTDAMVGHLEKSTLEKNVFYIVDESVENKVNSPANFELVNRILWNLELFILNRSAVEAELRLIEKDHSNGVDELLDALI